MILPPILILFSLFFITLASDGALNIMAGPVVSLRGATEKTVALRTHSLYAPYVDSDLQNRWFDFGGSAIINTNKHIRLTQDRASQAGFLWSRLPIAPNSFEIEIEFRVDGESNSIFGDGMAIWLAAERMGMGPVFGSGDYWNGLMIGFDTYANSRHPYSFPRIYGILNNGKVSYDSGKDGQGQEIGACSLDFRRTDVTAKARITYFKGKFLELAIHHERWDEWTTCFVVPDLELPANPFLGFTAHTGDVHDNHDIISVSTSNVVYHPPVISNVKPPSRMIPGAHLFGYVSVVLKYLAGVVVLGVVFMAYRGWKVKRDSKRF